LVVDDDPGVARLLEVILGTAGHEVLSEPDGARALIAAHESAPDLVFMDIVMPIVDGITALRLLRGDPHTAHIPVAIITGHDDYPTIRDGYDLGAEVVLGKPFEPDDILEVVHRLVPDGKAGR
jgi:CheY-like chemotaxis protein